MAKAMQTHGLFEERWEPPRERFVRYERSDETWMRPLGMGVVRKIPKPLFDVRMPNQKLLGYTYANPCERMSIRLSSIQDLSSRSYYQKSPQPFSVREIELRSEHFAILGELFVCWVVYTEQDAIELIEGGFIKHIGTDNIHKLIHDLRAQAERNRYCR